MSTYILVVDDEPDVENPFRQQFRRDIRAGRFIMGFAASAPKALERAKTIAVGALAAGLVPSRVIFDLPLMLSAIGLIHSCGKVRYGRWLLLIDGNDVRNWTCYSGTRQNRSA